MSRPDQCDMIVHMPFLEDAASRARIIIEIGLGHGNGSTRAFNRGLVNSPACDKLHVGVDLIDTPDYPDGREVPESYFEFVQGASEDPHTAEIVHDILGDEKADIIFIDTIHIYEHMEKELPIWSRFAGPQTLWIFHDTWMFGLGNHMTVAILDYCNVHPEWEFVDHSRESHGLGLMRWKK